VSRPAAEIFAAFFFGALAGFGLALMVLDRLLGGRGVAP
jgi:hypothetical protein